MPLFIIHIFLQSAINKIWKT